MDSIVIDLTALSYEEWLKTVFAHPVDDSSQQSWYWRDDRDYITKPEILLEYMRRLCQELSEISKNYSIEEINQGLWFLFGESPIYSSFSDCLFDLHDETTSKISMTERIKSIRCIYYVYANFIANLPEETKIPTAVEMIPDFICHDFWSACDSFRRKPITAAEVPKVLEQADAWLKVDSDTLFALKGNKNQSEEYLRSCGVDKGKEEKPELEFAELSVTEQSLLETIFETLIQILALDNRNCQYCALHGIGHSRHPRRAEIVQAYLDQNLSSLPPDIIPWIEGCREGTIM